MIRISRSFRINIGFLINQTVGFQREVPFEYSTYQFDEEFRFHDLHGVITLERTKNGIRSLGNVSAKTPLECSRCLETFTAELNAEFEEIFTFANRPLSEDETIIPENGNLDFAPLIRDYLLLEIPYSPICNQDCKGLCPICGENLNEGRCSHINQILETHKDSMVNNREYWIN